MTDGVFTIRGVTNEPDPDKRDDYKDRLLKLIPGETVSLYAISTGLLTEAGGMQGDAKAVGLLIVFLGCLGLTVLIRWVETYDTKTKKPQGWSIAVSCVSFVIYAYTLGGPFRTALVGVTPGWNPVLGTLVSGFWTVAVPYLYRAAEQRQPPA